MSESESYDYDPTKGIKSVQWDTDGSQHVWVWFTNDEVWWSVGRQDLVDPELIKIAGAYFSDDCICLTCSHVSVCR